MSETPYAHGFDSILVHHLQDLVLEMNAERDTALAERDTALAERDTALAERDTALAERDTALAERDTALAERDTALAERAGLLASRSWRSTALIRGLAERSRTLRSTAHRSGSI